MTRGSISRTRPEIDPADRSWPAVIPISGLSKETRAYLDTKRETRSTPGLAIERARMRGADKRAHSRPVIDPEELPGPAVILISGADPESRKRPRPAARDEDEAASMQGR